MMLRSQRKTLALLIVAASALVLFLAPRIGNAQATPSTEGTPTQAEQLAQGQKIFETVCMACHQAGAKGIPGIYPALAGDPFVTLPDPKPMIDTVLNGRGGMPRFAGTYTDEQIAAVVSYVRGSFGNKASAVTPQQVHEVREAHAANPPSSPEATMGVNAQSTVAPNATPAK